MKLNVFALVCLAASLVPASLGQDINIGSDGYSGIQIGGKDVTCPGNNFGDISNGACTCADGSPCRTADDSESPEPASPEPASPEPASPEPASPEPASPEPAFPEPASPEPASPEPASPEPAPTPATSATVMTLSGVALIAAAGLVL